MKILCTIFVMFLLSLGAGTFAQDESYICKYLFASSNEITQLGKDVISLAVDAVWEASDITGTATTTGTLTQSQSNSDVWTYSPAPSDELVLIFSNGSKVVFKFYSIDGYTDGTADDFKYSHLMDFNTFIENQMDIRIYSNTYPQNGIIYWQRTIKGTGKFDSQNMTVNITHNGNLDYDISSGYAYYKYTEQATGSTSTGSFSVTVNEGYAKTITHNSNIGVFASNTEIINNSSGNFNGTSYRYQNAHVFWAAGTAFADSAYAGYYDNVIDPNQWLAEGIMLKNGEQYGTVQFNGPILTNTYGPNLVLHLNTGNNILIHPLIATFFTNINSVENNVTDFKLMQNYPNPFNPATTIKYSVPEEGRVILKVYDILGNEVETLVNEKKTAGFYEIKWEAKGLASGIYFYRITIRSDKIQSGSFVDTKKMILMK